MIVQSGVGWEDINAHLADLDIPLFFPLDPGPGATIGGMIGTGCSGTNACRYGTAKAEWVLNVTAVLPDGEIIKTRQRARSVREHAAEIISTELTRWVYCAITGNLRLDLISPSFSLVLRGHLAS